MRSDSTKDSSDMDVDASKKNFNIKPLKKSKTPNLKYLNIFKEGERN